MTRACLVDTPRCIGCRACQVACKQSNGLKAEETTVQLGFFYDNNRNSVNRHARARGNIQKGN